mgnify:FL=1
MPADDHEARMMAQQALNRIDGHETLCTERWDEAKRSMDRTQKSVDGLYRWRWATAVSIILLLFGLIAAAVKLGGALHKAGLQWP